MLCVEYILTVLTVIWGIGLLTYLIHRRTPTDRTIIRVSGIVLATLWALVLVLYLGAMLLITVIDRSMP